MTVSTHSPFRIVSGGTPVGIVRATSREDALAAFTSGRRLPDGVDLSAYSVSALETNRPKAARGYRTR